MAAFEPKVPHLVPTRPIAASELDLGVYDKLDDLVTGQDHGVLALLAGQHKCSAAAVKGPKRPRRRQERRWEAQDSPGGRDLAAVLAFAAHLHDLAGRGHLTRLLLRRADE